MTLAKTLQDSSPDMMPVRIRHIEQSLSLSKALWRLHEGMEDCGLHFVTALAATRVDQGTILVPAFVAVLLGPDVEIGADAMLSALATLDEPRPRELEDQLRVKLVMDIEPTAQVGDAEQHQAVVEREAFL